MLRGLGSILVVLCLISALFLLRKSRNYHKFASTPLPLLMTDEEPAAPPLKSKELPRKINSATSSAPDVQKEVHRKVSILDEILQSKNDNDLRLDTDLKVLNDAEKEALRSRFKSFAHEKFNERGTIIFLLGRNISSKEDVAFFDRILAEPTCQSLENCSAPSAKDSDPEAAHLGSINSVTMAYPQIMTIKSYENFLAKAPDSALSQLIIESLKAAARSQSLPVANLAANTLSKVNH